MMIESQCNNNNDNNPQGQAMMGWYPAGALLCYGEIEFATLLAVGVSIKMWM